MYTFSFIDFGIMDFIRKENDEVLKLKFNNYEEADDFVMSDGLNEYGWTNKGTRIWCWENEMGITEFI